MSEGLNVSKLIVYGAVGVIGLAIVLPFFSGSSDRRQMVREENYHVQVIQRNWAADGLDLQAVGQLVKDAKDAEDLEKLINTPKINNLDLGADGEVDYIKVQEYGSGTRAVFPSTPRSSRGKSRRLWRYRSRTASLKSHSDRKTPSGFLERESTRSTTNGGSASKSS